MEVGKPEVDLCKFIDRGLAKVIREAISYLNNEDKDCNSILPIQAEFHPVDERSAESEFIGVFQVVADGNSFG